MHAFRALSILYRDIAARSRDVWLSIQLIPRGNDALLAIFAGLRVLAVIAIALRLEFGRPSPTVTSAFAFTEAVFLVLALLYAFAMLFVLLRDQEFFFSQELKLIQVVGDVLVYSGAYYFAQDPHSDIYFLNVMPLLIAIEYFSFSFALLIVVFTSVLHVAVTLLIPAENGLLRWFGHDFLPRTFIIGLLGASYLIHRRLRPLSDATLERERAQLVAELHQIGAQLPPTAVPTAEGFERDLRAYLDKIDWYRRMLMHEANGRVEQLSPYLFDIQRTLSPQIFAEPGHMRDAVCSAIDGLARAVGGSGATLRVAEVTKDGASVLGIYHATGCAAAVLAEDPAFGQLALTDDTIVVEAYRTGLIQKWVAGSPGRRSGKAPFRTRTFVDQCGPQAAIAIPLTVGAQSGVAAFYRTTAREFTPVDQALLLSVLDYMSVSLVAGLKIQSATQLSARREQQLALVREFANQLPTCPTEAAMLAFVVEQLVAAFGAEAASVLLFRGEELQRAADAGLPAGWFPEECYAPGQSITGEAFVDNSPYVLENRAGASTRIPSDYKVRYEVVLPSGAVHHILAARLQTQSRTVGVLRLINRLDGPGVVNESGFDSEQATLLVTLASLVAMALESRRRLDRQEVLVKLAHNSNRRVLAPQRLVPDYVKDVCEEICTAACKALNTQQAGVILLEPDGGLVASSLVTDGLMGAGLKGGSTGFSPNEGVMAAQVQRAFTEAGDTEYRPVNTLQFPWIDLRRVTAVNELRGSLKPLAVVDAQGSPDVEGLRHLFALQGVVSALLVPLLVNGEMIGILSVESLGQRRPFAGDDVEVANLIGALGAPAIAAARKLADERRVSREEERARIRHDLHNLRGIMNSTIVVDLQLMEDMLDRGEYEALAGAFRVVRSQLSFMHNQFGILMLDLHDPVLYEEGLIAAIDNYIGQSSSLSRRVSFTTAGAEYSRHLSLQVQHVVYRIAQEAITNACNHGIAGVPEGHVEVYLACCDASLELEVKDNGRGFDPAQPQQGSLGLNIMHQWAADMLYKANLVIDSALGMGTRIHLCVDLAQDQFENTRS